MIQGRVTKENRTEGLGELNENGLQWIVEMLDGMQQPVGNVIGNGTNGFLGSERGDVPVFIGKGRLRTERDCVNAVRTSGK